MQYLIIVFVLLPFNKLHEMRICYIIICWLICFATPDLFAQRRISPEEYINAWKELAVSEMRRSGIPASITLAQGMLESSNGNSRLALVANNHFGIKCHGWEGEEIFHDDDHKNECFRQYRNAQESYFDHTDFLMSRSRYGFLFEYKSTDYKSWAHGLRKAGYATDPKYAQALISLIERYSLYLLDMDVHIPNRPMYQRPPNYDPRYNPNRVMDAWDDFASFNIARYPIREINRTNFIIAREGDTYTSLSNIMDMMPWQLPRYNDAKASDELHEGQVVYIQPKRRKAERGFETHTVREGETLHSISQKYAVKMQSLYTLNRMNVESQLNVGDVLNLRKKKKQ